MHFTSFSFFACLCVIHSPLTTALVVTGAPPIGARTATTRDYKPVETNNNNKQSNAATTTTTTTTIRIRSTQESDLDHVSSLLASASLGLDLYADQSIQNFKVKMDLLRSTASMKTTLQTRFRAINEGRKLSSLQQREQEQLKCNYQRALMLWSRDTFRQKIEKAANTANNDPHVWKGHNFALSPPDPSMLQHAMMTAEDVVTGDVVGFCEIAMLYQPPTTAETKKCAVGPTISNLVISPNYRRRGIASSLLDSAARYVRHSWSSDELGLYVDQKNSGAVNLYARHGFEKESETDSGGNMQWYMSRPLTASAFVRKNSNSIHPVAAI